MPSRALGPASEHCVFIYLHRSKATTERDYRNVVTEYLPETFNHPIFLFLRPDGSEIDEALRHEHEYLSGSQIADILKKKVWPETGKGIRPRDWKRAEEAIAKATVALDAGDLDRATRSLRMPLKLSTRCGVRDRARFLQRDVVVRRDFTAKWDALSEAARAEWRGVREALAVGDLLGARRLLLRAPEDAAARKELLRPIEKEIVRRFEVTQSEPQLIIYQNRGHTYLEVSFAAGLRETPRLVVEMCAISEASDVFEARATFRNVTCSSRKMVCGTLPSAPLRGELVRAVRTRIFVDGLLVAEGAGERAPEPWPEPPSKKVTHGPDFFKPGEAYHISPDLVPEDILVGRVP
jgi:hypothetical protein